MRDKQKRNCMSVSLHASAVNVSGKALIFLGHSTAGKSTISQLLSARYPIISDDKVKARKDNNENWLISEQKNDFFNRPKKSCNSGRKEYPLFAVARIYKGKTTIIMPLTAKKTCQHLVDAIFEISQQDKQRKIRIIKEWFAIASEISKKVKGIRLTFKKDPSTIKKIHEKIEKECM